MAIAFVVKPSCRKICASRSKYSSALKRFALANVQVADGHQRDLIFGFVLQDVLVFGDGLREFSLMEILLRRVDVFALVIGHCTRSVLRPPAVWQGDVKGEPG